MFDHQNKLFHYMGFEYVLWIPESKFNALPVYNSSLPTGPSVGFRWKRMIAPHPQFPKIQQFRVGEAIGVDPENSDYMRICWYRPIVIKGK